MKALAMICLFSATSCTMSSPTPLAGSAVGAGVYTHAEIIAILETPEWSPPEEE